MPNPLILMSVDDVQQGTKSDAPPPSPSPIPSPSAATTDTGAKNCVSSLSDHSDSDDAKQGTPSDPPEAIDADAKINTLKKRVSPLRDLITDVDHEELDLKTIKHFESVCPEDASIERRHFLTFLVTTIVMEDTRLSCMEGFRFYENFAYFVELLEECYERRSFKEIRQLGALLFDLCLVSELPFFALPGS
jgi:hypothetical protein